MLKYFVKHIPLQQVKLQVNLSLSDHFLDEVRKFLKTEAGKPSVVVMPDFFLDRLVEVDCDEETFCRKLAEITSRKGGNIDGVQQTDLRGGNAVNTASALAALGANVTPIVCTNRLGLQLIKVYLKPYKPDLSHVKTTKEPSITTAIEFETKDGKTNVMLRDVGGLVDFGPRDLGSEEFEVIENANYVCIFNWAGTRRFGTELAKTVFERAKTRGRGRCYYDTADPTTNRDKIPDLVKAVLQSRHVDVLSVNENEAVCYASYLDDRNKRLRKGGLLEKNAKDSAEILASHLPARVDLHTTSFSASYSGKRATVVPAFDVQVLRATGAGDAWNAGNIVGEAGGLSDGGRLTLANAVAAYYVSSLGGTHPTRKQLLSFLSKTKLKKTQ